MKSNSKIWGVLAVSALLTLASCGGNTPTAKYERGDDDAIYNSVLKTFENLVEDAHKIYEDDARYLKYAEAEGELLAQGLMVPTYTQGGTYSISRAAPKTVSAAVHGLDSDRLQYLVATKGQDKFVKASERAELKQMWQEAKDANDSDLYDPKAYLEGRVTKSRPNTPPPTPPSRRPLTSWPPTVTPTPNIPSTVLKAWSNTTTSAFSVAPWPSRTRMAPPTPFPKMA